MLNDRVSSSIFLEPVDERELPSTSSLLQMKKIAGHDDISVIFANLIDRKISPF